MGYYLLFQGNRMRAQLVEGPQFTPLSGWLQSLSSFHCALWPSAFTEPVLSWCLVGAVFLPVSAEPALGLKRTACHAELLEPRLLQTLFLPLIQKFWVTKKKKSAEQTFLQSFYLGPYAEHNGKECLPCRPGISIQERLGPERTNRSLLK